MDQDKYLKLCIGKGMFLGEYDSNKVSGLTPEWFWERQFRTVDFRGDLAIRSAENITFGFDVSIYTASHMFWEGGIDPALEKKRAWIDDAVFVGSGSILYNCHLNHHVLVSIGSVVRNMVVPPYCMVEGNPAMIVREYRDGRWRHTENCQV